MKAFILKLMLFLAGFLVLGGFVLVGALEKYGIGDPEGFSDMYPLLFSTFLIALAIDVGAEKIAGAIRSQKVKNEKIEGS